ncbi:SDR family oxidoreductase [Gymnodinialimonas sp. 2305UL16-5]|uniref:SDR family oxidoreductase n=1 Tax=Gymnodinialimonas mytili TaxID=3126503 RepID=UPI0030A423CA
MAKLHPSSASPVVLVTGTSSGIGEATVHRFARKGWRVVATTRRNEEPFADLPNVRSVYLEQADPASIKRAVAEATEAFGRIDVLVNNAGYCLMGPMEAVSMEQIRAQYEVNVFGLIAVTQAALPHLKRAATDRPGKAGIINIASISADNGYPFNAVYSSSKGAVMSLTEGLNVELEVVGLYAKAVLPGFIATDIFSKLDAPETMPDSYHPLWEQFSDLQSEVKGFTPEQVAKTIFKAATDGKADKVRYYPTPDASSVPRAKRLMGQDGYWRTFRRALLEGPTWLQRKLAPSGNRDVTIVLPRIGRP